MTRATTMLVMLATLVLTAPVAHAETDEQLAEDLVRHERFAAEPVKEIRNFRLYRWKPLGETALAIWANPGRLYLVEVDAPCNGLDWTRTIRVSSTARVISSRFDAVEFGSQRCQIVRIRPVDEKGMWAERRRERESERR